MNVDAQSADSRNAVRCRRGLRTDDGLMHGDQAASRCDASRLTCPVRARRRIETARRHRSASDDVCTPAMRCGAPGYSTRSTCRRRRRCDANARAGSDRRRASRRMQRSARARTHPVQRRDRQDPNDVVAARALERERMRDSAPARRIGCALRSDGDVRSCPANRLPPSFATRGRSSKRSGGRSGKPMVAARDCVTTRCNPADGACTPDACVRAARTCSAAWRPVEGQPDTAASSAACTCVCCLQRGDVELRHLHHRSGNARRLDLIAIGHHRNERFRNDLP